MTYIKDTFVRHVDSIFVRKCIYERILDGSVRVTAVARREKAKGRKLKRIKYPDSGGINSVA